MQTLENKSKPSSAGAEPGTDTLALVKKVVLEAICLEDREFTRDTSLTGDLNADSLDLVQITMGLEEAFGVALGDDALELTTAGQIVDYIEAHAADRETGIPYM